MGYFICIMLCKTGVMTRHVARGGAKGGAPPPFPPMDFVPPPKKKKKKKKKEKGTKKRGRKETKFCLPKMTSWPRAWL